MTFGLQVWNKNGLKVIDTSSSEGVYTYVGSTITTNTLAPIAVTMHDTLKIISMAAGTVGSTIGNGVLNLWVPNTSDPTSYSYSPPSYNRNAGSALPYSISFNIQPIAVEVACFGKRLNITPTGFGLYCNNIDNYTLINKDTVNLSVHNNLSGVTEFTATANSVPIGYTFGYRNLPTIAPNIIFPKPLLKVPLIFITESNGPVALYSFTKTSGFYTGATIITKTGTTFNSYNKRRIIYYTAGATAPTVTFSYRILAEDEPLTPTVAENFGLIVFKDSTTKAFDSRWSLPTFRIISVNSPKALTTGQFNFTGVATTAINAGEGVCINNWSFATSVFTFKEGEYEDYYNVTSLFLSTLAGQFISVLRNTSITTSGEVVFTTHTEATNTNGAYVGNYGPYSGNLDTNTSKNLIILRVA